MMTQSPVVRIELASLFAEFKHEESDSFSHVLPVQQLVTDLFTENEYSLFQRYSTYLEQHYPTLTVGDRLTELSCYITSVLDYVVHQVYHLLGIPEEHVFSSVRLVGLANTALYLRLEAR